MKFLTLISELLFLFTASGPTDKRPSPGGGSSFAHSENPKERAIRKQHKSNNSNAEQPQNALLSVLEGASSGSATIQGCHIFQGCTFKDKFKTSSSPEEDLD
uniref:uncharacterized protein LOC120343004 n=1 Tax=Styela clava TaxID=7725 RepID=UPI00193A350A|nr:uncharacterized protein LOC120343004 [Styela clava]